MPHAPRVRRRGVGLGRSTGEGSEQRRGTARGGSGGKGLGRGECRRARRGPHTEADKPRPKRWTACGAEAVVGLAIRQHPRQEPYELNAHVRICAGGAPVPLSTLRPRCRHRRRMTRGQRGSLVLRCGAPSAPTLRRFIPALSDCPSNSPTLHSRSQTSPKAVRRGGLAAGASAAHRLWARTLRALVRRRRLKVSFYRFQCDRFPCPNFVSCCLDDSPELWVRAQRHGLPVHFSERNERSHGPLLVREDHSILFRSFGELQERL